MTLNQIFFAYDRGEISKDEALAAMRRTRGSLLDRILAALIR